MREQILRMYQKKERLSLKKKSIFDLKKLEVPFMEAITLKKLKTMLFDDENPIFLLDVRTPQEHYSKRIQGAINIPLDTLPSQISLIKDKPCIVVHCAHGFRAKRAAEFLYETERLNVYFVKGDIELWEQAELPILYEDDFPGTSEEASR